MSSVNPFERFSNCNIYHISDPRNNLDRFTYTKDLGFPAEKLMISESESLKNHKLVPFLANLDDEEYKHLEKEDECYRQANVEWREMNPLCNKVAVVGLGMMFGSLFIGSAMKSTVGQVLMGCSLAGGSVAWVGGLFVATHYNYCTGFKKVLEARLQRLNEKVQVIQGQILSLNDCSNNGKELEQLNAALTYFKNTRDEWNGRVIRDLRLPICSKLVVKFDDKAL